MGELLASLGEAGARGLVLATTRAQRYTGELDRIGIPLSTVHLAEFFTSVDEIHDGTLCRGALCLSA